MIDVVAYIQSKAPAYEVSGDNMIVTIKKGEAHTSWVLSGIQTMDDVDIPAYLDNMIAGCLP